MKKIILLTTAICFIYVSSAMAQDDKANELISFTDRFLHAFKSVEDDFSIVKISPQMLKMITGKSSPDNSKESALLNSLKGLYILSYDKGDATILQRFNQQIKAYTKEYDALMDIKDGKEKVQILTKSKNGKITDFVMIATEEKSFTLINILGEIDLNALTELQSSINVKGLENLNKLDTKK